MFILNGTVVFCFWLLVDEVQKMLLRYPFEPFHLVRDAAVRRQIRFEVRVDSFSLGQYSGVARVGLMVGHAR